MLDAAMERVEQLASELEILFPSRGTKISRVLAFSRTFKGLDVGKYFFWYPI
ncbi:hypothetical protein KEM60_00616 [Austwickia sp. TVS 96-490-7B]|nr:hypothetical protein [Austwickia sp. TVS 96-490-7B]